MPLPFSANTPTLALAPMAGVTDRVFRDLCRETGADYAVSEMVASKKNLWQSAKSSSRHADQSENSPRIVQLLGTQPDELAEAAEWQQAKGADVIDLNMGCPAKKVCDVAAGSALLAYPDLVEQIFKAVKKAVDIPVTVKIRTGTDPQQKNAIEIAQLAEDNGLSAVTIHGRTRADKFNGQAEYDTIRQVKQAINIPVIANGDICTPQQADFVLKYTLCDGIMIGRAAQGYPWIFKEISHYLATGEQLGKPSLAEFKAVMTRHMTGLHHLYGERHGYRIARKHLGWYSQHLENGLTLRKKFNRLESCEAQLELINRYFENHDKF
ncbi:MAG: tRNA dihydrouridine synthase DusB [Hydrogenovibrio sp.]|nr:tRNA dihydrouridine synthase DusB [Hydrogenovibrio sp.]